MKQAMIVIDYPETCHACYLVRHMAKFNDYVDWVCGALGEEISDETCKKRKLSNCPLISIDKGDNK